MSSRVKVQAPSQKAKPGGTLVPPGSGVVGPGRPGVQLPGTLASVGSENPVNPRESVRVGTPRIEIANTDC